MLNVVPADAVDIFCLSLQFHRGLRQNQLTGIVAICQITDQITADIHSFSVQFLDVGQGDATLIECDGRYMLIDGGKKSDSDLIYTTLKTKNVEVIFISPQHLL